MSLPFSSSVAAIALLFSSSPPKLVETQRGPRNAYRTGDANEWAAGHRRTAERLRPLGRIVGWHHPLCQWARGQVKRGEERRGGENERTRRKEKEMARKRKRGDEQERRRGRGGEKAEERRKTGGRGEVEEGRREERKKRGIGGGEEGQRRGRKRKRGRGS